MSAKTPIIRQGAAISAVPQLLALAVFVFVAHQFLSDFIGALLVGTWIYLLYALLVRCLLAKQHRKGIRLVKKGRFAEAIPEFEASYEFFKRNSWLDQWRYLTLLSSSAISYREMALCNIAYSYSQQGNGQAARDAYERALREYPNSSIATSALNIMRAATNEPPLT